MIIRDITILVPIYNPAGASEDVQNEARAHAPDHFDPCESLAVEKAASDRDAKLVEA